MDANDFAFIESQLEIVLPIIFRDFMSRFPNDREHTLQNECDFIPCNAELFVVAQLQLFDENRGCDFYALQPELRPRRFVNIGGDACGNYFCMVGDDRASTEVWLWEHDPYNGFGRCVSRTLRDYFGDGWKLVAQPDPLMSTKGVFVLRADHPVRSILDPISFQEWLAYIAAQPHFDLDETEEVANPFSGELIVVRRWPGRARVTVGNKLHWIEYLHGALKVTSHDFPESELKLMADNLSARVWRDAGG